MVTKCVSAAMFASLCDFLPHYTVLLGSLSHPHILACHVIYVQIKYSYQIYSPRRHDMTVLPVVYTKNINAGQ